VPRCAAGAARGSVVGIVLVGQLQEAVLGEGIEEPRHDAHGVGAGVAELAAQPAHDQRLGRGIGRRLARRLRCVGGFVAEQHVGRAVENGAEPAQLGQALPRS
jgi:hypothetical protein